jgi:tRNA(fMet)-specific endonuclease VapC
MGGVKDRLLAVPPGEVGIPAVVVFELEKGIALSTHPARRRRQMDTLLQSVHVLPFDRGAAERSAQIAADLKKSGRPIGPFDTLIAGTALAAGASLVTHNLREFRRVPGLKIVDWF